jgi:Flp pilus assembly protein TadG
MSWRSALSLLRDSRASTAAEFALVLPLLLILLFGIIDGGRFAWEYNQAEKATQVGARMAVVTDVISTGLRDNTYVGVNVGGKTLKGGDTIPVGALGTITCNSTTCSCTGACGGITTGRNATAFTNLVTRMTQIKPDISAVNVRVLYRGSGLGYAGDPNGMEMSPLVTVELTGLQFRPIASLLMASFDMPSFATTLTAEDSVGSVSN